jgi:hypothetical protein
VPQGFATGVVGGVAGGVAGGRQLDLQPAGSGSGTSGGGCCS